MCSKCRWFEVRRTKQHLFSRIVSRGSSSDTVLTHFGIAKRGSPHLSSNPKIQSLSQLKAQFTNVILHTESSSKNILMVIGNMSIMIS